LAGLSLNYVGTRLKPTKRKEVFMKKNVLLAGLILCATYSSLLVSSAQAQEYPMKPITLIISFTAGGTPDLCARKLSELLRKDLNSQPVVVENKVGGAGTIGGSFLSSAAPDGYTIGALSYSFTVIVPHLRKVPYDTKKDFTYIMQFAEFPEIF
jgi:tripartite-type tricarboxylate transporter receptor subunit TctC